jgi:hypothetical protein
MMMPTCPTDAAAAEAACVAAAEAARNAEHTLEPVSVLISRDTQRLYVRQAFEPILDIPVTIRDPELQIGTHVFTAVERADKRGMQWSVVSLVGGSSNLGPAETLGPTHKGPDGHAEEMDLFNAKAALDRIVIPEDTVDRIREMVSPRSSLIISDEGPSPETGRGTEFVIIMSGEPQGGLTNRRHRPEIGIRYEPRGDHIIGARPLRFLFNLVAAFPSLAHLGGPLTRPTGPRCGPRRSPTPHRGAFSKRQDRRYYIHETALNSLIGMRSYGKVRCILNKATQELTVFGHFADKPSANVTQCVHVH